MKTYLSWIETGLMLAAAALSLGSGASTRAQVQTTTTTTSGQSTQEVKVDRGEVVAVEGNDLIVKMEDGSIRHFPNIPENARATVDGKPLSIHELKPGMTLQRTITTTTTPQIVTTVETVSGTVWRINPPLSVILTLENGTNQSFTIPKNQKFKVNGEMVDAFGLKKGMRVTATKITEVPMTATTQQRHVTGTMPPPPSVADTPILIAEEAAPASAPAESPGSAPAAPATAPATAPQAAQQTPPAASTNYLLLIGLLVVIAIIVWLVVKFARSKPRT